MTEWSGKGGYGWNQRSGSEHVGWGEEGDWVKRQVLIPSLTPPPLFLIHLQKTTDRFRADRGFAGADVGGASAPRSGPVQFERADDFGLDSFLEEAKEGSKRREG